MVARWQARDRPSCIYMDTYGYIMIHNMDTYGYIWGPWSQALAQNWLQGPWPRAHGTLAHFGLPPVLGQGLAFGPHVDPYYVSIYIYIYIPICSYMFIRMYQQHEWSSSSCNLNHNYKDCTAQHELCKPFKYELCNVRQVWVAMGCLTPGPTWVYHGVPDHTWPHVLACV